MPIANLTRIICLFYLLILGSQQLSFAQSNPNLEFLTINDGLSQGYANCLLQDKDGFIWIGTKNGLNRYDGYHFKHYSHNPFDSTSLSGNWIMTLQDYGDFLLLGFLNEGLNIFDKKTGKAYSLTPVIDTLNLLTTSSVHHILVSSKGDIWLKARTLKTGSFLIKLRLADNWLQQGTSHYIDCHFTTILNSSINEEFNFIIDESGDNLWYWTEGKLTHQNFENVKTIIHDNLIDNYRLQLSFDTASNQLILWADEDDGISRFDGKNWHKTFLDFHFSDFKITEDGNSMMFTGHNDLLEFKTADFSKNALSKKDAVLSIPTPKGRFLSFLKDKSGIIWGSTSGYGVIKHNPRLQLFKHHFQDESVSNKLFVESHSQLITFGNKGKTLQLGENKIYNYFTSKGYIPCQYHSDSQGNKWVLVQKPNTNQLLLFKAKFSDSWIEIAQFDFGFDDPNGPVFFNVQESGRIIVVKRNVLKVLNLKTLEQCSYQSFDPIRINTILYDLKSLPDGSVWIGTELGLIEARPVKDSFHFQSHRVNPKNINSLSSHNITSLLPDYFDPNILWIGTNGGGLNRLNTQTNQFRHFTTSTGFPNDVIYGILSDEKGGLWMSSNKGIIHFNPAREAVKNYTIENGLPTNEFNRRAYAKAPDGTMNFGCIEGLISFNPSDLSINTFTPTVKITNLLINDSNTSAGDSTGILEFAIEYTDNIELDFSQNNISLELSALEFSIPEKNKFRYYLEGAEPVWAHETYDRKVTYLNLNHGDYTFWVKASNSDGVWSDQATKLHITILPPWYQTPLAYAIYIFAIAGAIYGIFWFFLYRQKLKHRLLLEQKEAERLKELDEFKSNLYTNITHEFRTPLTVIKGMTDQIGEYPEKWLDKGLKMIRRNTDNLLSLVNQILELRKLRTNTILINNIHGDIVAYIRYIVESYHSYIQSHELKFSFQTYLDACFMDYDPEKLQGIITNLISNAVKYTPPGGDISLRLSEEVDSSKDQLPMLVIKIQDSGQGIPAEDLPLIFDRFYRSEHTATKADSSGIGLSLVKELVKLMDGDISVESLVQKGTTFTIKLPIQDAGLAVQEFDTNQPLPIPTKHVSEAPKNLKIQSSGDLPSLLIMEDNLDVATYLMACVETEYHVSHAEDGEKGVQEAIENVPDIIISDVMMPKKDGFEVVNILKNDERTSHIPIVMLTAKSDDASKIMGIERGADAYLPKPFNKEELLVRLRKLLELRKKLQERYALNQLGHPANLEESSRSKTDNHEEAFLLKVKQTLEAQLDNEQFGVAELCQTLGMSRTQLHNKIKALTGKSTSLFIRSHRLQKARQLLLNTEKNISEIALDVGFKYPQHFSNYYMEEFGEPPSKTRC